MKMIKISKILTVVTMIAAMAVPAFGSGTDYNGPVTINAASGTADVENPRIGQGALTTIDIVSGGILNAVNTTHDKMRLGEGSSAIINVQAGGEMHAVVELNDYYGYESEINVYGTAYIEQLRMYGNGNHNGSAEGTTSTILVDGTLTCEEGLLGKKGIVEMTIGTTGTFIVAGWAEAGEEFSIDSEIYSDSDDNGGEAWDHGGYASYLDIVGNGRMLIVTGGSLRAGHGNEIRGNGVVDAYEVTVGTVGDEIGYDVYTAVAEVLPGTVFIIQ
jgi:hypothetical protein